MAARIAALGLATLGLSACYYDAGVGLGYYDDGYSYYDRYDCDPYSPFDSYYDCDYRYGFYNIGYGGGWYQDYWYPGYGFYIFDRGGKRYRMYDHHRRYWAGKRHEWYREHHGRRDGRDRYRDGDRRRNYGGANGNIGWPEQHGGRVDDRRGRDSYRDPNAVGNGQADIWHRDRRREDRRGDGRGERRRDWPQNGQNASPSVPPVAIPQSEQPSGRGDGRGWRRGAEGSTPRMRDGNRRGWQAPQQPQSQQSAAPAPAVAQPRTARPGRDYERPRRVNQTEPQEN